MHLKCSEIVWMQNWKERFSRFRRRFFLRENDLIEFIQQFEKFKDDHRALINGFIMQAVCKSEFDQKIDRLDIDRMELQIDLSNAESKILGLQLKLGRQAVKLKVLDNTCNNIDESIKKYNDRVNNIFEQESKKLQEKITKLYNSEFNKFKNVLVKLEKVDDMYDVFNNMKTSYDSAYYLQESMDKLAETHQRALKEIDLAMSNSKSERSKLNGIADQYRNAVDIQAKGHIASMQGILRELERKNK